jgi:hypothetical protein
MIGFKKYLLVIFREKDEVKIRTRIGGSCLGLLQTRAISIINKEKKIGQISMKKNKTSCDVIGGYPAGLVHSALRLHQMIECCDLYD